MDENIGNEQINEIKNEEKRNEINYQDYDIDFGDLTIDELNNIIKEAQLYIDFLKYRESLRRKIINFYKQTKKKCIKEIEEESEEEKPRRRNIKKK